jgi:hypothetical protein
VTGGWKWLRSEEVHSPFSARDVIKTINTGRMRLAGHVARIGDAINAYKILIGT